MDYLRIPASVGTLADLQRHYAGAPLARAQCLRCAHNTLIDFRALVLHFGPEVPVADVRDSLRCQKCGSRHLQLHPALSSPGDHSVPANVSDLSEYRRARARRNKKKKK